MTEILFLSALFLTCAWGWSVQRTGWTCEKCGQPQDFFATPWLTQDGCVCIECGGRQ